MSIWRNLSKSALRVIHKWMTPLGEAIPEGAAPPGFVRCTEVVPSPCCGEKLKIIGSKERKLIKDCGERLTLIVRRMRWSQCYKIHHELPDCIVPYKRYESSCVEQAITKTKNLEVAVPADESTLHR